MGTGEGGQGNAAIREQIAVIQLLEQRDHQDDLSLRIGRSPDTRQWDCVWWLPRGFHDRPQSVSGAGNATIEAISSSSGAS